MYLNNVSDEKLIELFDKYTDQYEELVEDSKHLTNMDDALENAADIAWCEDQLHQINKELKVRDLLDYALACH